MTIISNLLNSTNYFCFKNNSNSTNDIESFFDFNGQSSSNGSCLDSLFDYASSVISYANANTYSLDDTFSEASNLLSSLNLPSFSIDSLFDGISDIINNFSYDSTISSDLGMDCSLVPPESFFNRAYTTPFEVKDGKYFEKGTNNELTPQEIISQGLDTAEGTLGVSDLNGDGYLTTFELANSKGSNFAMALDVNGDGLINDGEKMAYLVYQDSKGTLDGVTTSEERMEGDLNIQNNLNVAKTDIKNIYDTLKASYNPTPEKATIKVGTININPNGAAVANGSIGTFTEGSNVYSIIPSGENQYQMVDAAGNAKYNCAVDGQNITMTSDLNITNVTQFVDDGNGNYSLQHEIGLGLITEDHFKTIDYK